MHLTLLLEGTKPQDAAILYSCMSCRLPVCVTTAVTRHTWLGNAMQIPLAMDAIGSFVVAASAPLDIRVWRVDMQPVTKLNSRATATLTLIRELSIMSVGQPLRVCTLPAHFHAVLASRAAARLTPW